MALRSIASRNRVRVSGRLVGAIVDQGDRSAVTSVTEAIDDFDRAVEAPLEKRMRSGLSARAMIAATVAAELRGETPAFRLVLASPAAKAEEKKVTEMLFSATNALQRKLETAGAKLA